MKLLTGLLLLVLITALPLSSKAQKSQAWIKIAPDDELFQVRMPQQPRMQLANNSHGGITAAGRVYSTCEDGVTYSLWSLSTGRELDHQAREMKVYLDAYADFIWESLLKPVRDTLPTNEQLVARMIYKSELSMGQIRGREYALKLGHATGATRFYMDGPRLYVLVGLNAGVDRERTRIFFGGFLVKPPIRLRSLPVAATLVADPMLIPPDVRTLPYSKLPDDRSRTATPLFYNRIFEAAETTHRARVISKPEPQYTEAARSHQVCGIVVLSVVLSKEGSVENIRIVKGVPHGLTQAAITAVRQLRFTPATKDGYVVSQYARLEYNFNLY